MFMTQTRTAYQDKDPLVKRLLQAMVLTFVAFSILAGLNVLHWLAAPLPVAIYSPERIMIGTLNQSTHVVVTPTHNGVPLVAIEADGRALVPIVLSRCTEDGPVEVTSTLTVDVDLGQDRPTLVPRGGATSLTFHDGCTGTITSRVLLTRSTVELISSSNGAWLRFQLSGEDRELTVVETERFELVVPGRLTDSDVRHITLG